MNKATTDQLESDSRPSSGVYSDTQAKPYSEITSNNNILLRCYQMMLKSLKIKQNNGCVSCSCSPPGFYELSDGGSCSLSNSCTSVYSECLSSSQTSLLHPSSPATSQVNPPSRVEVCRRRSADESSSQPHPPRATGLHLGSSRIRANTAGTEHKRPRPVSTGNPILSHVIKSSPSMNLTLFMT